MRWTWADSGHSVSSGPRLLACPIRNFVRLTTRVVSRELFPTTGTVYQHTFTTPGTLFVHLLRTLRSRHDRRGQRFRWLRTVGMVCRSGHANAGVRMVGVYFPANGKFYAMGGRSADTAGSDFTHPFEYDPASTVGLPSRPLTRQPGKQHGLRRANRLWNALHLLRGRFGGRYQTTATDRVFRYNPVTDMISPVAAPWPGAMGTILPGGFTVFNNKLYILADSTSHGGHATNQIWEFTPSPTPGCRRG